MTGTVADAGIRGAPLAGRTDEPPSRSPCRSPAGGLEAVKWFAFVAMVADHADLILADRTWPLLHAIGAFAFPAFAITFGMGLAASRDPGHGWHRLLLPAIVAEAAWWLAGSPGQVNILFGFMACALAAQVIARNWLWGTLAAILLAVSSVSWEAGGFLPLFVLGGWLAGRFRWWGDHACFVLALPFVLAAPVAGTGLGIAAPILARRVTLTLPRVPGLLAWGYPAHLFALAVIDLAK